MEAAWTGSRSASTVRSMLDKVRVTNPETQLASYFVKYEPAMAKLGKALRAKLRDRLFGTTDRIVRGVDGVRGPR